MNPIRLPRLFPAVAALAITALALAAEARAVTFDFTESTDYSDNFHRTFLTIGSGNALGHSAGAGTVAHSSTASGTGVFVYDTAPDGTVTNTFTDVTVSFDFSTTISNVSFGVFFGGDTRTSANLALFNINNSGAQDQLRFFTGGNLNTGAAGTVQAGLTQTFATGGWTTGKTYHAVLTIDYVTGTTANVTYTISDPYTGVGALTSVSATATGLTVASAGEIGFRTGLASSGGTLSFDNISITTSTIPEPSAFAALGGVAALGCAAFRRRRQGRA